MDHVNRPSFNTYSHANALADAYCGVTTAQRQQALAETDARLRRAGAATLQVRRCASETRNARTRIYADVVARDGSGVDASAPEALALRKDAVRQVMAHLAIAGKAHFSRLAGCRCGCSAGWVVDGHHGWDIFVLVTL